jgi:hypothetical protein
MKTRKTELDKLIDALQKGEKSKEELEAYLGFKTVVKNIVNKAKSKGHKISLINKKYRLEQ